MKKSTCIIALVILGLLPGCNQLRTEGREEWIRERLPEIAGFVPGDETPSLEVTYVGGSARILGHEGYVSLTDGDWIYFKMCSSHSSLSDLIIAKDNNGQLYACNGHVCPDLILSWPDRRSISTVSLKDFQRSEVSLGTGNKGSSSWVKVNEWKSLFPSKSTDQKADH